MAKRILLFVATNLLVITTMSILLWAFGVGNYITATGIDYKALMTLCLLWGFIGSFISLGLSRIMAKWMMGVKVIDPNQAEGSARWLVDTTHRLCNDAGLLKMPEVGVYDSEEPNAFATGPTRSRSLVAVSTGLLSHMSHDEIEGVLAHEVSHIVNGDMVTMTLIQGVINAFVMFLARVVAFAASAAAPKDFAHIIHFVTVIVLQILFSILGSIVVCFFSRQREFSADIKAARLAGKEKMQGALEKLEKLVQTQTGKGQSLDQDAYATLKISSGKTPNKLLMLFSTHPPLTERINRLKAISNPS